MTDKELKEEIKKLNRKINYLNKRVEDLTQYNRLSNIEYVKLREKYINLKCEYYYLKDIIYNDYIE